MKFHHCCLALCLFSGSVFAQAHVDPKNRYERIVAVVPIVGTGTYSDPKRPLFAPGPQQRATGIDSFRWQASDDGRLAVVEFVARDRKALAPILADSRVVIAFEKAKGKKSDIEKELKKYRKDFSLDEGTRP